MEEKGLQVFGFEGRDVRVVIVNGEPWWVAKDVCDVLQHTDVSMALSRLDKDEKGTSKVCTLGGEQQMSIVSESGLYALVIRSNKPEAKPFRKWITSEVLPAIRKTGKYGLPSTQPVPFTKDNITGAMVIALGQRMLALEEANSVLAEDKEILEVALNRAVEWRTVMQYNQEHNMGWDMQMCQAVGKAISGMCRSNGYEIRKCKTNDDRFDSVNSYSRKAWEQFEKELAEDD